MHRASLLVGLLAIACADQGVTVYNTAPTASIQSPADGAAYQPGALIEFTGVTRDNQQDPSTLLVTWTSSIDGVLGESTPDSEGIARFPINTLSGGVHAITLTAIDDAGLSGSATISVDVGYGGAVVGAPTVTLVGPEEGDEFPSGQRITVVGTATDDEQPWNTLTASLLSSRDGLLWQGNPASSGAISLDLPDPELGLGGLSVGGHALSLSVEDEDGNVASATVNVTVLEDGRPVVAISSPADGATFLTSELVSFVGAVSDDVSDNDAIQVEWSSSRDGVKATGYADSSGAARASFALSEGVHVIELAAWDEDGNDGSDTLSVTVIDPLNYDNDGDGQTENQGDCDDNDPLTYAGAAVYDSTTACMTDADGDGYGDSTPSAVVTAGSDCDDADAAVSPRATEVCDAIDNDCDGSVNENAWDGYEANNSRTSAYNLGEVDQSWLWNADRLEVSALSMHEPGDEDWFQFDVDDAVIYDNANFTVTLSNTDTSTFWILELYDLNSSTPRLEDTAQGWGSQTLQVGFEGDLFDGGEDDWAVRVYSTTWSATTCSAPFILTIRA